VCVYCLDTLLILLPVIFVTVAVLVMIVIIVICACRRVRSRQQLSYYQVGLRPIPTAGEALVLFDCLLGTLVSWSDQQS